MQKQTISRIVIKPTIVLDTQTGSEAMTPVRLIAKPRLKENKLGLRDKRRRTWSSP
jgi:hypothetical protein